MNERLEELASKSFEELLQPLREYVVLTEQNAAMHEANHKQTVANYNAREAELLEQIARLEVRLGELSEQLKAQE